MGRDWWTGAMDARLPAPLRPGDTIAVTAPSSGVPPTLQPRLDLAIAGLRRRGFEVVEGVCLRDTTDTHVSASREARADELMALLVDPDVHAVIPPWGGETGIDVLPWLDLDLLAQCDPTWYVGFSDTTTTMLPLTLQAGWATLHGSNLMDTPAVESNKPPVRTLTRAGRARRSASGAVSITVVVPTEIRTAITM
ncbi:LD-carboxypeptidase [Microlunatus sp. Y2014]|uniref:LD-carboxypeptidase n=1 Tax=Microlunatus sp. Y2014 TaxID=3418488 RepID=UPI003DA7580C